MPRSTVNTTGALLVIAGVVVFEALVIPDFGSSPGLEFTVGLIFAFLLAVFGFLMLAQRPYAPGILSTLLGFLMIVLSLGFLRSGLTSSPYLAPGVLISSGGLSLLVPAQSQVPGSAVPQVGTVSQKTLPALGLAAVVGSFVLTAAFEWEYWFIPECFLHQGGACGIPIALAEAGLACAVAAVLIFLYLAWMAGARRISQPPTVETAP